MRDQHVTRKGNRQQDSITDLACRESFRLTAQAYRGLGNGVIVNPGSSIVVHLVNPCDLFFFSFFYVYSITKVHYNGETKETMTKLVNTCVDQLLS